MVLGGIDPIEGSSCGQVDDLIEKTPLNGQMTPLKPTNIIEKIMAESRNRRSQSTPRMGGPRRKKVVCCDKDE